MSKFAPSAQFLSALKNYADGSNKLKLVDRILKELEFVEYFYTKCPSSLSDRDWSRLLKTRNVADRVSMLEYIALTQKRQAEEKSKKEQKQKETEAYLDEQRKIYESGGMGYGPYMYSMTLNPFRNEKHINHLEGARQLQTRMLAEKPKIAFDCQWFTSMPVAHASKMSAQVSYCLTDNDVISRTPFHLELLNLDLKKSEVKEAAKNHLDYLDQQYGHQRILPDVYKDMPYKPGDRQVLYVTKFAHKYFDDGPLPSDKTIILPVTMDNNRESINYCKRMKFTPIYLPVRKYIKWKTGAFFLPLPNILKMLNMVTLGYDWKTAIEKNVAQRHVTTIEERRERLGPRYDKRFQEKKEKDELIQMIEEALDKERQVAN
uniref:SAM-dependent MTase TRM10-type domain-containing protein n=1 Tax=Panagrolaimus sp. JU765 TaxID=591449 RepID=A0AC34QIP1_9BILA